MKKQKQTNPTTPPRALFRGTRMTLAIFLLPLLFLSQGACIKKKVVNVTDFSVNKQKDKALNLTKEERLDRIREAIGEEDYNTYVAGMGQETLDLLSYAVGTSNIVELLNAISSPGKLVTLLTDPNQISAIQVLDLMNLTNAHLEAETPAPPSLNTVGKIANMVNNVNDMNNLKSIVHGMLPNGADPEGYSPMERLTLVVALVNETTDTMPTLINEVGAVAGGVDILLRVLNETTNMRDLITIINDTSNIFNLTGVFTSLTNDGPGGVVDGTDALIATLNNTTDPAKLAYLVNNLTQSNANSNDDNFDDASALCGSMTRSELSKFYYASSAMEGGANDGQPSWFVNGGQSYSGSCSAQSDSTLDHEGIAAMEMTMDASEAGTFSFRYKTSIQSGQAIREIRVTNGGSGYTAVPTVSITGGGGTGATATATISEGVVTGVSLTSFGSGYTSNPTIAFVGGGGSGATAVARRVAKPLYNWNLTNGGSGYTSKPEAVFSNGEGGGAVVDITMSGAAVNTLSITNPGSGYALGDSPTVTITPVDGNGSGASATASALHRVQSISLDNQGSCTTSSITVTVNGNATASISGTSESGCSCSGWGCTTPWRPTGIDVTYKGTGYTSAPSVTTSNGGSGTATMEFYDMSITKTSGGSGYTNPPNVTLSGGSGSGAQADATIFGQTITSATLVNGGSWTKKPSVTFVGGGGSGATATFDLDASPLSSITITDGGANYSSAPSVTITPTDGNGSGAAATASVSETAVTGITLTNAGTGYTGAPTVTITGGGGGASGATAEAVMSGDYFKFYIDDELKLLTNGDNGWQQYTAALNSGTHRFRWEYVRDDVITGGSNQIWIDDVTVPGGKGAGRYPYEKVAILLNSLYIDSITNVADILNGADYVSGMDNLTEIINTSEYPADFGTTPRLVEVVNNLDAISTMNDLLANLGTCSNTSYTTRTTCEGAGQTWSGGGTPVRNLVMVINSTNQIDKIYTMVNNLTGGTPGQKLADILNPLEAQGASALVKTLDNLAYTAPLDSSDEFNEMMDLINNIPSTADIPEILNGLEVTGGQSTVLGSNSAPTGGEKLAQVISQVKQRSDSSGDAATCDSNEDSFCTKNQLVRLVNDISNSTAGPRNVGAIISNLDGQINPTGIERIVDILYNLKVQDLGDKYTDKTQTTNSDQFGRLTTMVNEVAADGGAERIAGLINRVSNTSNLSFMILNSNRLAYMTDLLNMLTSEDLMVDLLNDPNTQILRIETLLDHMGDISYTSGSEPSPRYTSASQTEKIDPLGRIAILINEISGNGITNLITLVNDVTDLDYVMEVVKNIDQIRFLTNTINGIVNIDLMVKVFNGADTCTDSAYLTESACTAGGETWDLGIGQCDAGSYNSKAACEGAGNTWTGAQYDKLMTVLNGIGNSTVKGGTPGAKAIGNMDILWGTINELGYNGLVPRTEAEQVRLVRLVNSVEYCGLKPAYDQSVTYGPYCSNGKILDKVACQAAGATWNYDYQMHTCDSWRTFADYDKSTDTEDKRPRLLTVMLGLDSPRTISIIAADVIDTQKTVNMINGARRINTILKTVNYIPGEAAAELMNTTHRSAIYRGFVYLANNLEPDEDTAAQAFASMIHHGTGIPDAGGSFGQGTTKYYRNGTCSYFTGIGPSRLGEMLNTDNGQTLEGIIVKFGWRTTIAAAVCGFGVPSASSGFNLSNPQVLYEDFGSAPQPSYDGAPHYFYKTEELYVDDTSVTDYHGVSAWYGAYTHQYMAPWWGSASNRYTTACKAFLRERTGASALFDFYDETDRIVWDGFDALGNKAHPGIAGVWDIMKGNASGLIAWLLNQGSGEFGYPPYLKTYADGTPYANNDGRLGDTSGSGKCAGSGDGNENECLKPAGTSEVWGTYCSDGVTTSEEICHSASGKRWRSNKNFYYCQVPPSAPPVRYNCSLSSGGTVSGCNSTTGSGRKGGGLKWPSGYSDSAYP